MTEETSIGHCLRISLGKVVKFVLQNNRICSVGPSDNVDHAKHMIS